MLGVGLELVARGGASARGGLVLELVARGGGLGLGLGFG